MREQESGWVKTDIVPPAGTGQDYAADFSAGVSNVEGENMLALEALSQLTEDDHKLLEREFTRAGSIWGAITTMESEELASFGDLARELTAETDPAKRQALAKKIAGLAR